MGKLLSKYNLNFDELECLTFYQSEKNKKFYVTATINDEECFIEDSVAYSEQGFESVIKMFENKFKNKPGYLQIDPYIINLENVKYALPCASSIEKSPQKYYLMITFQNGTVVKTKPTTNKSKVNELARVRFRAKANDLKLTENIKF